MSLIEKMRIASVAGVYNALLDDQSQHYTTMDKIISDFIRRSHVNAADIAKENRSFMRRSVAYAIKNYPHINQVVDFGSGIPSADNNNVHTIVWQHNKDAKIVYIDESITAKRVGDKILNSESKAVYLLQNIHETQTLFQRIENEGGIDFNQPTLYNLLGLLYFMSDSQIKILTDAIRQRAVSGSVLLFTHICVSEFVQDQEFIDNELGAVQNVYGRTGKNIHLRELDEIRDIVNNAGFELTEPLVKVIDWHNSDGWHRFEGREIECLSFGGLAIKK